MHGAAISILGKEGRMREEKIIGKKHCFLYHENGASKLLIQPVDAHDLELLDRQAALMRESFPQAFYLTAFLIEDWNDELSPWPAPAVFGEKGFAGGAAETLTYVESILLPEILRSAPNLDEQSIGLGGYSLAGLFALWAAYQTDWFRGIAAVSPSVWFPGWEEYIDQRPAWAEKIYLSLGDKEEKTKNKTMARVGANIRKQQEVLVASPAGKDCVLEWNAGNHFTASEERMAKGFSWLLGKL